LKLQHLFCSFFTPPKPNPYIRICIENIVAKIKK
jgi:hypothetical protein